MFAIVILVLRTLTAQPLAYARDAQYEYLGTTDGLWRSARLTDPSQPLERIAFPGQRVQALTIRDAELFAGKQPTIEETSADHTLVVSSDHGATFTPIDEGLRDCSLGCGHMAVHQIAADGGRLFVNAAGNIVVSPDEGQSWTPLFPSAKQAAVQTCPVTFDVVADSMLLGGECPLDIGWIGRGTLTPDGLHWRDEPQRLTVEDMANRNVQFIEHVGATVFAGVEGGLLRSDDGGASYRWSIYFPLTSGRYPYIRQLARAQSGALFAGGFDKGTQKAYLVESLDGGETWIDISPMGDAVTLLAEEADGRVLIAVTDGQRFTLGEVTVGRRRSVAHP